MLNWAEQELKLPTHLINSTSNLKRLPSPNMEWPSGYTIHQEEVCVNLEGVKALSYNESNLCVLGAVIQLFVP